MKFKPYLLFAALLTGCVAYQPKPLVPEQLADRLQARRLDDPGLQTFLASYQPAAVKVWPRPNWDLDTLTLAAFYFHPDLAVARRQWQAAAAGVKTAAGRPNPTVSVSPTYNSSTFIPSPWSPGVTFDLPLETAGKRSKRMAAATAATESARWQFTAAAWQVRSQVRNTLADYQSARRRLPLLEQEHAIQQSLLKYQAGSLAAGAIARPELLATQQALAKAELELAGATAKCRQLRSQLAAAVGVTSAALADLELAELPVPVIPAAFTSDTARQAALIGRADIRAALADYAAAEDNLQLEIARQYPDIHLNPGYQFDQGDNKWTLGFTVELPILNQNQGPIAEARAQRDVVAAKFLQLQAQVISQVEQAVAGWESAQAQQHTATQLLANAQAQHRAVVEQVAAGAATPADLAAADLDQAAAQLAQFDSLDLTRSALFALEDALQNPADSLAPSIEKLSLPLTAHENGK
ncbi:MAG TPA: TolC family protein [Verrucomicrobiae bacterium]